MLNLSFHGFEVNFISGWKSEHFPISSIEFRTLSSVNKRVDESIGKKQEITNFVDVKFYSIFITDQSFYRSWQIQSIIENNNHCHHLGDLQFKENNICYCYSK